MTRDEFDRDATTGALIVGSPTTVADKIVRAAKALGLSRFDLKYSNGTLSHEKLMTSIGLYGREVAPMVREQLA
jgi:alkanesulfonate monooxygenase SsuD/methylene tetrahydromethanopterin reductase-like flavin-dependent oxidoreductase (luciferase family)